VKSYWMQMTDTNTVLELRDSPMPQPDPRQLLVRMHAAALKTSAAKPRQPWLLTSFAAC
jgi:NADPH:quinone reductase-like Zn-dependent oxidoreductase